jgi:MtrB/PioB family decaheme-associated outer membrane protein
MTIQKLRMQRRPSYLLTLAALCAMAPPVVAEPMLHTPSFYRSGDMSRYVDNYVELGVGYNSDDSYKFGEWNGLREDGAYPIVGFNWLSRNRSDDASYWQITGSGLGLETRKFGLELGTQGRWKLNASADRLVRSELDTARFIHPNGLGTSNLGGIATVPITAATPTTPYNIEQGRNFYRLGLSTSLSKHWDLQVAYREDVRDGARVMGVPFNGFANPNNVPYEIDDHTQQFDTTLAFADSLTQIQFAYHFSRYENKLDSLTLQNPVRPALGATATLPDIGRVSLMPSNDYHQISATGTYRLTPLTRISSKLSYGLGTQNDAFLPYTTGTVATALPRASLDGELARTLFDLALTTRPSDRTSLRLAYQYFDHDNQTPRASYLYARQDADQGAVAGTSFARTNAPLSTTENKLTVDGDLRLQANTVLRGVLEYSQKDYRLSDRARTENAKAGIELRRPIFDTVSGALGYDYSQRTGDSYNRYAFIAASYDNPQLVLYHPSLRAFHLNDFTQNKLRANANWVASETITLQGSVEAYQQQLEDAGCSTVNATQAATFAAAGTMPDNCLGRNLAEGTAVNLDLQWQPEENFTAFTFVNYSVLTTEQSGRAWTTAAQGIDATRNWFATIDTQDHAVGTGFKWQPDEAGRWNIGGHYVFSDGRGRTNMVTALAGETAVPDSSTTSHSAQLYAKWMLNRMMTLRFNYLYETLEAKDWALTNPTTGQSFPPINGTFVWTGQGSPRYENHAVGVSVALHSW